MVNRGSEWRRWELHLHTPGTKKSDQYTGSSELEKWENFYSSIAEYIGDGTDPLRAICAIAVTDYLTIDNYFKVRSDKDAGKLPDCVQLLLPNVELRMIPTGKESPINIHCIFDPVIAHELQDRFFAKLRFEYGGQSYGATRNQLIRLGKNFRNDNILSDDEAYRVGLNQYVISSEALSNLFKDDPSLRESTIIVVANKDNDGVSGLNKHAEYRVEGVQQLEATRENIYHLSDMIFSSNSSDIKYFLGKGADNAEVVKRKYGALMPCIHGSDAHRNDQIFAPANDRFCWIKADPTFEGLKQILCEPEERVQISSTFPDSKSDYHVIDRIEIAGNEDFSNEPIYLSDKLTCIIGGKSTGKSLLLHNIALAIDPEQVSRKSAIAHTNVCEIQGSLKVFWRDGACSADSSCHRKIVYIPQTYLNHLSDKNGTREINSIVQEIILQDNSCRSAYQCMTDAISRNKEEITRGILDFLQIVNTKKELLDECQEIGDSVAITTEINKIKSQIEALSKEGRLTEEDIDRYHKSVEQSKLLERKFTDISKEYDILTKILSVIEEKSSAHLGFDALQHLVGEGIMFVKKIADTTWIEQRNKIMIVAEKMLTDIQQELECEKATTSSLEPKINCNEQIRSLSARMKEEIARKNRLDEKSAVLDKLNIQYEEKISSLSACFEDFRTIYDQYIDTINKILAEKFTDLKFSVRREFFCDNFQAKLNGIINQKTAKRFESFNIQEVYEYDLSPSNIKSLIESLTSNAEDSLQLKVTYSAESALRELMTDWYGVNYIIQMDRDEIQYMSPGKKALVLLRILINLAESKCPILIDQPEDDLDNRSIFNELIKFIRAKKIDRQIVVVTHNANIVLGGDAELVIVANQDGTNAKNRKYRFEYRCGSIENNTSVANTDDSLAQGILESKGMQEHICEILEGGQQAFDMRRHKYRFATKL